MKLVNEYLDDIKSWERKTERDSESEDYKQLCIWPSTQLGDSTPEDFEDWFRNMGFRVRFMEEVITLPGQGGPGGRCDLFFYIHSDDISKFAIPRIEMGIRWWEDVILNKNHLIYHKEIIEKYPKTW